VFRFTRSAGSALALASLLLACRRAEPLEQGQVPSARPTSAGPRVLATSLSSPTAFELVADARGLRLLWASEQNEPGWLLEAELAQDGAPRAKPRALPLPRRTLGRVTDLSAAFVGEELAFGWIEQSASEARAVAAVTAGAAPAQLLDLGAAAVSAPSARGNIAVAGEPEQGRALVMWRGLDAPCVSPQPSPCTGFTFRRLRPGIAEPTGLPLSVPVPCVAHSVQLSVSPGRFYYGVCTREGVESVTTMFSIQYDPEYARAEPLLKGCLPLGTVEAAGKPWLVADCRGKRHVVPVPHLDEKVEAEPLDAPQLTCTQERAELRQGRFVLSLREPRAGLEPVLPSSFVPSGARAGWTGRSLLVTYVADGRLQTRAFACQNGRLLPG
jgi:hypothetical protein